MFKNKTFLVILVIALLAIVYYSISGAKNNGSEINYSKGIMQKRTLLDDFMRNDGESPMLDKSMFVGLKYFEIDTSYKINARFERIAIDTSFIMMTDSSKGKINKIGNIYFLLNQKTVKLSIYQEGDNFMLPFRDLSNGSETYGGGRYINIEANNLKNDKILIDFNEAHNFYCAYNHNFICPQPPPENKIDMAINAGEKNYLPPK